MSLNPADAFRHERAVRNEAMERTRYVATINVPGYMPMDDESPVFESTRDAWEYLASERERDEEDAMDAADVTADEGGLTSTVGELRAMTGTGTVYGSTPGSDSEHDLGLAYSVDLAEDNYGIPADAMADGHRYVMGAINSYCPRCSELETARQGRSITALTCDFDRD